MIFMEIRHPKFAFFDDQIWVKIWIKFVFIGFHRVGNLIAFVRTINIVFMRIKNNKTISCLNTQNKVIFPLQLWHKWQLLGKDFEITNYYLKSLSSVCPPTFDKGIFYLAFLTIFAHWWRLKKFWQKRCIFVIFTLWIFNMC